MEGIKRWYRIGRGTPEQDFHRDGNNRRRGSGFTGDGQTIDPYVRTDPLMGDHRFRFKVDKIL